MYILHTSISWLIASTSSSSIVKRSLASIKAAAAFLNFPNFLCWCKNTLLVIPSCSHMWSKRSAWEHDLPDLLSVIKFSRASIPASTRALFPQKIDLLMPWNIYCCFTLFSTSANTFKFERSNASTVWLLHSKWYGWWLEPSALGILSSIPRFFVTASVISESTFSHIVTGVVCWFSETFAEIDNRLKVSTNNFLIWSWSS